MHDWKSILNTGSGQVDIILLDFSKAFAVFPHEGLLKKVQSYEIDGKINGWIIGFLSN